MLMKKTNSYLRTVQDCCFFIIIILFLFIFLPPIYPRAAYQASRRPDAEARPPLSLSPPGGAAATHAHALNVESPSGVAAESRGRTAESGGTDGRTKRSSWFRRSLALDTSVGRGQRAKAQRHAMTAGRETLEPQTAAGFGG